MAQEGLTTERVQLCYCGNAKIFPQLLLSALSAAMHTQAALEVRMVTLDLTDVDARFSPLTEAQRALLEGVLQTYNPENAVHIVDAGEAYRKYLAGGKNEKSFYTPYTLLRLLFDRMPMPDKLLYLDTDTMCRGDIAELWRCDVSAHEFGAVRDQEGKFWIRSDYCNAGVLLLNVARCRETGLLTRARERVRKRRMIMPDQSALNFLAKKKLFLPRRFNEQRGIRKDTVVKHFCRGFKWYGPFFRIYNIKQTDRQGVHERLHIDCFDDVFAVYDALLEQHRSVIEKG